MISVEHYLALSAVLLAVGVYGVLTRRNAIAMLMSIEIMFNAVNVAMVAIARYVVTWGQGGIGIEALLTGQAFALFIIAVAAAEVALGLAIVILMQRSQGSVDVAEATTLRR